MLGGLIIILITGLASFALISELKKKHPLIDDRFLKQLFFYHLLLFFAYYAYVSFNPSDSKWYYEKVTTGFRGPDWWSFYGTSTTFIEFVGYPFIRYFFFSYEAIMALFSWFGYLGFVCFYFFFRENIRFSHHFMGYDFVKASFLLPNLHFWSASFGKGALIFLGLALFFLGISKVKNRWITVVIGGFIIYHVRPHIMLVVLLSSVIGFVFSNRGISMAWRVTFLVGAMLSFFFIYRDVMQMVGMDDEQPVAQSFDLAHRAVELTKATSGVDITSYSLPMQVFTFLYRPLFIDAPGALGLIVSFENVFYLLISIQFFSKAKAWNHLLTGNFLVKSTFMSFLTVTIALAQISGNLGLAIRQKSQVMLLFLFVIISFFDEQKFREWRRRQTPRTGNKSVPSKQKSLNPKSGNEN